MAQVIVSGVFMGAHLREREYEGKKTVSCMIDVYQPTSQSSNKMISVKSDDATLYSDFNQNYDFGSNISLECQVNAYRNDAYFKLLKEIEA